MQVGLKTYFCRVFHTVAVSMEKGETVGGACSPSLQVSHNTPVQPNHQLVTLHVLALVSETNNNRVSFFVTTLAFLSTLFCWGVVVKGPRSRGKRETRASKVFVDVWRNRTGKADTLKKLFAPCLQKPSRCSPLAQPAWCDVAEN